MIYLDNASTTRITEEVLDAMKPYFDELYFNASSVYSSGLEIKDAIEDARGKCAKIINAKDHEIIFTSGATEAINYALKGYLEENFDKGNHVITCKTEHKAVLSTCEYLEAKGVEVTYLNVDSFGHIDYDELEQSISSNTALIAIMLANNETGVLHDVAKIGQIAKAHNVRFFCDATQAIGKVHIDVESMCIDMLCMSGHKINGPKGIGFIYVKDGIQLTPLIHGGAQENNNRGGTYNSPLIIGLGKACELALENVDKRKWHFEMLRTYLLEKLEKTSRISTVGDLTLHLHNIFTLKVNKLDANVFIQKNKNVIVSNGSACTSQIIEGSHVLKAMGYSDQECNECIRISFDKDTNNKYIDSLINTLSTNK